MKDTNNEINIELKTIEDIKTFQPFRVFKIREILHDSRHVIEFETELDFINWRKLFKQTTKSTDVQMKTNSCRMMKYITISYIMILYYGKIVPISIYDYQICK